MARNSEPGPAWMMAQDAEEVVPPVPSHVAKEHSSPVTPVEVPQPHPYHLGLKEERHQDHHLHHSYQTMTRGELLQHAWEKPGGSMIGGTGGRTGVIGTRD